jgi:hypothetical protein
MAVSNIMLETGIYDLNAMSQPPKGTDLSSNATGRAIRVEAKKIATAINDICLSGKYLFVAGINFPNGWLCASRA